MTPLGWLGRKTSTQTNLPWKCISTTSVFYYFFFIWSFRIYEFIWICLKLEFHWPRGHKRCQQLPVWANSFLFKLIPVYKRAKNRPERVVSPENVSISLNNCQMMYDIYLLEIQPRIPWVLCCLQGWRTMRTENQPTPAGNQTSPLICTQGTPMQWRRSSLQKNKNLLKLVSEEKKKLPGSGRDYEAFLLSCLLKSIVIVEFYNWNTAFEPNQKVQISMCIRALCAVCCMQLISADWSWSSFHIVQFCGLVFLHMDVQDDLLCVCVCVYVCVCVCVCFTFDLWNYILYICKIYM